MDVSVKKLKPKFTPIQVTITLQTKSDLDALARLVGRCTDTSFSERNAIYDALMKYGANSC